MSDAVQVFGDVLAASGGRLWLVSRACGSWPSVLRSTGGRPTSGAPGGTATQESTATTSGTANAPRKSDELLASGQCPRSLHAIVERAGELVRESSMRILVTGANGFVGRTLCRT